MLNPISRRFKDTIVVQPYEPAADGDDDLDMYAVETFAAEQIKIKGYYRKFRELFRDGSGEHMATRHYFYTSYAIQENDLVWLPGMDASDGTAGIQVQLVEELHAPHWCYSYYKAWLST